MKLSDSTLSILKNFSVINGGIFVKKGSVLETISKQKNILARAEVSETFDEEFGIYDLNSFLGVLNMQKTDVPEIEFDGPNIIVKGLGGRSKIKYRKASKETILTPPDKKVNMGETDINFNLSQDDFVWITRMASTLGSPHIAFISDGEKVSMSTFDDKDDSAHVNVTELPLAGTGRKYSMIFNADNLQLLPGSYDVKISAKGIGHFKGANTPVEYWITTENGSKYE